MADDIIHTPAQAIEAAAKIADAWAAENRDACNRARKSVSEGSRNMADQLDGAAIECNAIAAEIRKLAELIGPPRSSRWREPSIEERPY